MAKINVQADCENSPKKALLRDITIAFAENNKPFILNNIADDIRWEMVGDRLIQGKKEAEQMVNEMLDSSIQELNLTNIITHGDEGCVNGVMKFIDETVFGFCDVYTFTSHAKDAKIKTLTSYVVEKKSTS